MGVPLRFVAMWNLKHLLVDFSYLVTLKSTGLSSTLDLLCIYYFVTCNGWLENIRSLDYADLSNMGISLYDIKVTFLSITTNLIRKVLNSWEAAKLKFSKI